MSGLTIKSLLTYCQLFLLSFVGTLVGTVGYDIGQVGLGVGTLVGCDV